MLRGEFGDAGEMSPEELRSAYEDRLVETVETTGLSTATTATTLEESVLAALIDGDSPEMTVESAAEILALDDDLPDAESIAAEARDILLMGMSMAVLDVEAVASGINDAMDPKEIQQKAEGRFPMTLEEYAIVHSYIEERKR